MMNERLERTLLIGRFPMKQTGSRLLISAIKGQEVEAIGLAHGSLHGSASAEVRRTNVGQFEVLVDGGLFEQYMPVLDPKEQGRLLNRATHAEVIHLDCTDEYVVQRLRSARTVKTVEGMIGNAENVRKRGSSIEPL